MPVEPSSNDIPQQIEYLWGLKSSITCSDTIPVIVSLLEVISVYGEAFTEDDWKLVQLVLTLFRNVLAVQDIPLQHQVGGSASQFDILLLLEIFHYIFMSQDPTSLPLLIIRVPRWTTLCPSLSFWQTGKMGGDTKAALDSLKSLIAEEEEKRKLSRLHQKMVCHSQFSGTFTRLTMDGSKAVDQGNPLRFENPVLKPHKGGKGVSNKIVWDHGSLPSTMDTILGLLHDLVSIRELQCYICGISVLTFLHFFLLHGVIVNIQI
ncbi:hypothetical protein Pint_20222 [Pistacia integerrima]|uniref:Uncharacterized protein n=1 Tax=Pistacia integerrima TaxID=434235 RepID=A0ACC0XAY5_9ROSI|nr:hypothetical protein Pint_20222 [Pistacia integerrima]